MLRQIFSFFCLFFLSQAAFAGQISSSDTLVLPQKISKFIPKGYSVLDTARGDLNLDKFQDVILILKKNGEDTAIDDTQYKRPLLLLLGRADKSFVLAARNDNVVYCFQCGGAFGDPFAGLEIKKGLFTVNHFGGTNDRWSNDITFQFSKASDTWYLFKIIDKGWNVSDLDKIESTVKTKKDFGVVPFDKYKPASD